MAELSPTAQAVLDAYKEARDGKYINGEWIQDIAGQVAAALRAAADQVAPSDFDEPRNYLPASLECQRIRAEFLAIVTELENHQ